MRKWRYIYEPIYGTNVYMIKCSANYYRKKARKEFGCSSTVSSGDGGIFEVYYKGAVPVCVMWISDWELLSHELFHCVHWITRKAGLRLSDDSEEAYAYLVQYLDKEFRKEEKCQ